MATRTKTGKHKPPLSPALTLSLENRYASIESSKRKFESIRKDTVTGSTKKHQTKIIKDDQTKTTGQSWQTTEHIQTFTSPTRQERVEKQILIIFGFQFRRSKMVRSPHGYTLFNLPSRGVTRSQTPSANIRSSYSFSANIRSSKSAKKTSETIFHFSFFSEQNQRGRTCFLDDFGVVFCAKKFSFSKNPIQILPGFFERKRSFFRYQVLVKTHIYIYCMYNCQMQGLQY